MRYKVPQNIDMPDRIVGPLTLFQFVEAVLGGGLAYVCYNAFPAPLNLFFAFILGMLTLAVVFVKINERPFLFYALAFIKYLGSPKQRVWQKGSDNGFGVEIYHAPKKAGTFVDHKNTSKRDLHEAAKQLDSQHIDKFRVDR